MRRGPFPQPLDAQMPQPYLGQLAAYVLAYTASFYGLQRSPLMPGPRLFLQAAGAVFVAAVALRHLRLL